MLLVIILPTSLCGISCIAMTTCVLIYYIYLTYDCEANAQEVPVVQPQQVALHPVYAGPMPDAPPSEMVPGQPATQPSGMVQGQPAFTGSPYMQPEFTAPPVPEHKDKSSSPSSEQQEDAPPSYDLATGGEP